MYWVMAILPFALLLLGFPIFLLLLTTSLVILLLFFDIPMTVVHQAIFNSLNKFPLLAVPFFVFAGDLMSRGGITKRLLRWVASLVGGFRAHIPMTSLGFAALFGAISGVTTAGTAAVGTLTYPRMREAGYSEKFAAALITAEGALDNLIPPSIAMIIYGIASDTSVIQLFAAGIGPGLLLAGLFGLYIYYYSVRTGISDSGRFSLKEFVHASVDGVWALGAILIILGGIYSGVFSPTEAAGVASVYAIFVSYIVYREATIAQIFESGARAMQLTGLIFIIVAVAGLYSWLLTISGIAQATVSVITSIHSEKWVVLLTINVFLLFVGCFLDPASALIMLTPLLAPVAASLGMDPIHFGVIVVMNLTIGTFHPPFGLNIFVCQALFKTPSKTLYAGLMPFVGLAVLALMLVTYIPGISLWIMRLLS
ncbi:MAG TPA: TRAP transporter large permease [Pseudolabrys sp.]|jgi:C4-dicarboxylate transporter DctM subunit|uniref:TRAP transporter large permease n=1 Tax=Pseudolabrys sp. TaxID=1960880 RepID=UPI002DDD0F6A|nr:TRAP transporter large permease [Pseudolabrys sp.]HEV2630915.1 TRAP transporter large permease [Pseudolabrys sp.]